MKEKEQPLVSVVMPAFNTEKYISRAVESVLGQTYPFWELWIVDDCSTDGTRETAQRLAVQDERIHYLRNEKNMGAARSRQRGIELSAGTYVAFLDSDDVWERGKLAAQIKRIFESGLPQEDIICYTSYDFIDENGDTVLQAYVVPETTGYKQMLVENVIGCSTVVMSVSFFREKGFAFEKTYYHEDYALWMQILRDASKEKKVSCHMLGLPQVLMHHRQLATAKSISKKKAAAERWHIYRELLQMKPLPGLAALAGYMIHGVVKYRKRIFEQKHE